jgi:5'-nucleotidase
MKILLTNDDGIFADGLRAASMELSRIGEVYVVAPDKEMSATGHGITVHRPLRVQETEAYGGKKAWAVDGTPSDCVKLAVECLLDGPPDVVVSGINRGSNLGTDVLYSGTVSAAIEGVIYGIPSIAMSLALPGEASETPYYDFAAIFSSKIVQKVITKGLPPDTLLNINVPSLPREKIKGIEITRLGMRRYRNVFDKRVDPRGRTYYWLAGDAVELDEGCDIDSVAVKEEKISITPIHFDLTRLDLIDTVKKWELQL